MRDTLRADFSQHALPRSFDLTLLHALAPARYPYLLESVAYGTPQARYDILFAFPRTELQLRADGAVYQDGSHHAADGFLTAFEQAWRRESAPAAHDRVLPFTGGWFVFLAYELAGEIEARLGGAARDPSLPLALATRIPAAVIHDHSEERTYLVADEPALIGAMEQDLLQPTQAVDAPIRVGQVTEEEPGQYLERVERAKRYIAAGDVFQVNLARRWHARLATPATAVQIYRRLRQANPAPFAGLMRLPDDRAVISSSPERLVQVRGRTVRTRPIAGTYPRSADPAQDRAWSRDLLAHPKERAEHVMLIDLERNDLGRVCRPGSMQVSELMTLESYRHVHHIVSEVRGQLRSGTSPVDIIRAVFPGGTITGCPKVRSMEIIAELEHGARGAYTGSMGYINHDGDMDLNILIRTFVQHGDALSLHAGAGIVADSIPERELNETRAKAKGLLAALEPL